MAGIYTSFEEFRFLLFVYTLDAERLVDIADAALEQIVLLHAKGEDSFLNRMELIVSRHSS